MWNRNTKYCICDRASSRIEGVVPGVFLSANMKLDNFPHGFRTNSIHDDSALHSWRHILLFVPCTRNIHAVHPIGFLIDKMHYTAGQCSVAWILIAANLGVHDLVSYSLFQRAAAGRSHTEGHQTASSYQTQQITHFCIGYSRELIRSRNEVSNALLHSSGAT